MRNIFIDLGSFNGDITHKFMGSPLYSPDFELHAFEANPLFTHANFLCYDKKIKIHRVAAWISDGELDIFVNRQKRLNVQGTSVFKEKITGNLDRENPVSIKCINFDFWLRSNFAHDDNIIIKSNIEGAEYPLFSHLMDTGTINYINRLYLRLHWHKIGMKERENEIFMDRLRAVPKLTIKHEYNFNE